MITDKQFRQSSIVVCVLICMGLTIAAQNRGTAGHPDFSGSWQLNRELSDDPQKKMKEAMGSMGGAAGAFGRIMGGMRGGGGKANERMKNSPLMSGLMKIIHNDPELRITTDDESGASKTIYTDGRLVRDTMQVRDKEVDTETTARWKGDQLVVTTQMGQGGKRTAIYRLAEDARQLIISLQIENPRLNQPIEMRLVYDADEK
jgi:hypothetical protein